MIMFFLGFKSRFISRDVILVLITSVCAFCRLTRRQRKEDSLRDWCRSCLSKKLEWLREGVSLKYNKFLCPTTVLVQFFYQVFSAGSVGCGCTRRHHSNGQMFQSYQNSIPIHDETCHGKTSTDNVAHGISLTWPYWNFHHFTRWVLTCHGNVLWVGVECCNEGSSSKHIIPMMWGFSSLLG